MIYINLLLYVVRKEFILFQGLLPVDYLDIPDEHKAENLYTNALQIAEQFEVHLT